MQIVRKASFKAAPWKNGGGTTYEAIRVPADGIDFRWRVSVAQIDVSGPFSDFAGYDRKMVLLRGAGVRLTFGNERQTLLRDAGDMAEFDGALATQCELLDGPCTDLNLMVSRSIVSARAWTLRMPDSHSLPSSTGETLVFPIGGTIALTLANGESTRLDAWDLAVISPGERAVIDSSISSPAVQDGTEPPLVFFATINDKSTHRVIGA